MTETIPTALTLSYDEYGIVTTFSEESLVALSTLQNQLAGILGDAIWLTPRRALHSTLMEIICDIDYGDTPRKQLFADWHEQFNQIVSKTIAALPPSEINFSELEVSPRAIIVRSTDPKIFNEIRSNLLAKMNLPHGTKMPPDITHCTVARYNTPLDMDDVIERTSELKVNFTEHIREFKLLKDLGPPTFDPKTIEEYVLRA
jgi:hypothetical protein